MSDGEQDVVHVLVLGEGWPPDSAGGLNRYVSDLVAALPPGETQVVVNGPVHAPPPNVMAVGDVTSPTMRRLVDYATSAARLARHSDVVDAHFAMYAFLPLRIGPARRKPLVVHFHGPWADEGVAAGGQGRFATRAKRFVERSVYRRATAVVTLSRAFGRLVVEEYGVEPWRVHVLPPAVDLSRFSIGDRRRAREQLSLPVDADVVTCVRRLTARMGVEHLLEAWARLPDSSTRRRILLIGGDGPARAELQQIAERLGIGASVRFLGSLTEADLVAAYRAADVSVVPSVALEGFGLVVLEALACGTPVITTDAGGLPEALAGLSSDAVVPAGRADALALRLGGALDGHQPLPDQGACVRHAGRFSRLALADAHRRLYRDVARGRHEPRLRVVYLDHCALLSGAEIALLRLVTDLPGVVPHVVLAEDGPLVRRLQAADISVEVLPLDDRARDLGRNQVTASSLPLASATHTAGYVGRLARRLHILRPDIVHCNSLKACLYGSLAARLVNRPVVWHGRDRIASDYLPDTAARAVRLAYRSLPTAVIANSQATLTTLARGGQQRSRRPVSVIPDPYRRRRAASPAPTGPCRFGIVGRLAPWKGQHVVLEAFARAFREGPEHLVVIGAPLFGEADYAHGLAAQASRLGISDQVTFRGFQDDVEAELDALNVLVHASTIPEPFGQVIVEGMAAGRAVIAADQGGPAEIITHGHDGLLFPADDIDALAGSLRRLRDEPGLTKRLSSAALDRARGFDPDVIGPQVMDLYAQVTRDR